MNPCDKTDNITLDLRQLYGSSATPEDKALRTVLADIDENLAVGDGNFKINTVREFQAVRDALEDSQPNLFAHFLKVASRSTDPVSQPKVSTPDQAKSEVRNFLRSKWAQRVLTTVNKKNVGGAEDCGAYFAVKVSNHFGLGKFEFRVDKELGKVNEAHNLNFWGERMGGSNSYFGVDKKY